MFDFEKGSPVSTLIRNRVNLYISVCFETKIKGREDLSHMIFIYAAHEEKKITHTRLSDACTHLFTEKYSLLLISGKGKNTIRDGINISIDIVDVDFRLV